MLPSEQIWSVLQNKMPRRAVSPIFKCQHNSCDVNPCLLNGLFVVYDNSGIRVCRARFCSTWTRFDTHNRARVAENALRVPDTDLLVQKMPSALQRCMSFLAQPTGAEAPGVASATAKSRTSGAEAPLAQSLPYSCRRSLVNPWRGGSMASPCNPWPWLCMASTSRAGRRLRPSCRTTNSWP